ISGKWKLKKHSLYTTVCITNENDASQTCPFCFEKSLQPATVVEKDGKIIIIKSITPQP
ncbi:hypothetical protein K501DRAFT_170115, partial [Backusella circina FSU 941]